jgi:hypothetical protein
VEYGPIPKVTQKKSPAVVKLAAEVLPQTTAGKVVVAASINGATNDVKVKYPENPENWRAELVIANL